MQRGDIKMYRAKVQGNIKGATFDFDSGAYDNPADAANALQRMMSVVANDAVFITKVIDKVHSLISKEQYGSYEQIDAPYFIKVGIVRVRK